MSTPSAPQNLNITATGAFAATQALMNWSPPVNLGGKPIDTYQVQIDGGTWRRTGSTRTRYRAETLARGTAHTFAVRAENPDGVGPASALVTYRTPIASRHNLLLFKDCVNYYDQGQRISLHGTPTQRVPAAGDNNYHTFTEQNDLSINIAVNTQPTRVDAVFIKGIGIDAHSATPTGGQGTGYTNRQIPDTVTNWEGTTVSTTVDGFQHDLYLLDAPFTATSVRLQFTGTGAKLYAVMLLEFGLEINANADLREINPNWTDRTGVIHTDPQGGIAYDPVASQKRDKWETDILIKVKAGETRLHTTEEYLNWRTPNRNCVYFREFTRHPAQGFPALLVPNTVAVRYLTDNKLAGETIQEKIAER